MESGTGHERGTGDKPGNMICCMGSAVQAVKKLLRLQYSYCSRGRRVGINRPPGGNNDSSVRTRTRRCKGRSRQVPKTTLSPRQREIEW